MKKLTGYLVSWLLFWLGDSISYLMIHFKCSWLYPIYNRSMIASVDVQDWAKVTGPWKYNK